MKKIEADTNRWNDIPCSWIGRTNIVQWSSYTKQSTDSIKYLSKQHSSKNLNKYSKICLETKKTPINQEYLKKEEQEVSMIWNKAIIIQIVYFWHKIRHMDQGNRVESAEMTHTEMGNLQQWGKDNLLINGTEKTGQLHTKESN